MLTKFSAASANQAKWKSLIEACEGLEVQWLRYYSAPFLRALVSASTLPPPFFWFFLPSSSRRSTFRADRYASECGAAGAGPDVARDVGDISDRGDHGGARRGVARPARGGQVGDPGGILDLAFVLFFSFPLFRRRYTAEQRGVCHPRLSFPIFGMLIGVWNQMPCPFHLCRSGSCARSLAPAWTTSSKGCSGSCSRRLYGNFDFIGVVLGPSLTCYSALHHPTRHCGVVWCGGWGAVGGVGVVCGGV